MKIFDLEKFKTGKIVVNCDTEKKAKEFLAYLHGEGFEWASGESLLKVSYWEECGSEICYRRGDREMILNCERKAYYEKVNKYEIIKWR